MTNYAVVKFYTANQTSVRHYVVRPNFGLCSIYNRGGGGGEVSPRKGDIEKEKSKKNNTKWNILILIGRNEKRSYNAAIFIAPRNAPRCDIFLFGFYGPPPHNNVNVGVFCTTPCGDVGMPFFVVTKPVGKNHLPSVSTTDTRGRADRVLYCNNYYRLPVLSEQNICK